MTNPGKIPSAPRDGTGMATGQETFPGWHRAYLRDFERALIEAPCLSCSEVLGPEAQKIQKSRIYQVHTNSTMKMAITLATFPIFRRPNPYILCDIPRYAHN